MGQSDQALDRLNELLHALPVAAWFGKRHRATISGAEAKP